MFEITKTYGHEHGFSTVFRQPLATDSHCGLLHGYALSFAYTIASPRLNERNWTFDFAQFKPIKAWQTANFDHTTVIAESDPMLDIFIRLNGFDPRETPGLLPALPSERAGKVIDLRIVERVGCEGFAFQAFTEANRWLQSLDLSNGAFLKSVTVSEHGANSATYSIA